MGWSWWVFWLWYSVENGVHQSIFVTWQTNPPCQLVSHRLKVHRFMNPHQWLLRPWWIWDDCVRQPFVQAIAQLPGWPMRSWLNLWRSECIMIILYLWYTELPLLFCFLFLALVSLEDWRLRSMDTVFAFLFWTSCKSSGHWSHVLLDC